MDEAASAIHAGSLPFKQTTADSAQERLTCHCNSLVVYPWTRFGVSSPSTLISIIVVLAIEIVIIVFSRDPNPIL